MLKWLTGIFAAFERQKVAAERSATALEDIAVVFEGARDGVYAKFGIEPKQLTAGAKDGEEPKKPKGKEK